MALALFILFHWCNHGSRALSGSVGSRHLLKGHKSYLNLMQIQLLSKGVNDPFLVPGQGFGAQLIISGHGKASNIAPGNGYFFQEHCTLYKLMLV